MKPEKGRAIEDMLIRQATRGLSAKVDEDQLKAMLEQIQDVQKPGKIIV